MWSLTRYSTGYTPGVLPPPGAHDAAIRGHSSGVERADRWLAERAPAADVGMGAGESKGWLGAHAIRLGWSSGDGAAAPRNQPRLCCAPLPRIHSEGPSVRPDGRETPRHDT